MLADLERRRIGSDEPPVASLGRLNACSAGQVGDEAPPDGCNAPVALELAPLVSMELPADQAHDKSACPKDDAIACATACTNDSPAIVS